MTKSNPLATTPATVENFVERFNVAWKRTAEGVLEIATVLLDAHRRLGEESLEEFYNAIKMDPDSQTSKKLRFIAKHKLRFMNVLEKLPNHWTTIWQLARLETDQFDQLVKQDMLSPDLTTKKIQEKFASKKVEEEKPSRKLTIDINKVDLARQRDFSSRLRKLLEEFRLKAQVATLDAFLGSNGTSEGGE